MHCAQCVGGGPKGSGDVFFHRDRCWQSISQTRGKTTTVFVNQQQWSGLGSSAGWTVRSGDAWPDVWTAVGRAHGTKADVGQHEWSRHGLLTAHPT